MTKDTDIQEEIYLMERIKRNKRLFGDEVPPDNRVKVLLIADRILTRLRAIEAVERLQAQVDSLLAEREEPVRDSHKLQKACELIDVITDDSLSHIDVNFRFNVARYLGSQSDRIRCAIPAPPSEPEKEWQPIETAPRDQRPILATHSDNEAHSMHVCWRIGTPYHPSAMDSPDYLNPRNGNTWRPTHWMPLPNPPAARAQEGTKP